MRMLSLLSAVALVGLGFTAQAEDKAAKSHLDATGGNAGEHQITYVANANATSPTMGTALIVLSKNGKQELAYGLYMDGETDRVDSVNAKLVKGVSKADDAKATVITVDVTADHYAKAKAAIEPYAKKKEHLDPPADVAMNCATEVLTACGMKPSYRSALRAPNPVQWFADISMNNRKMAVK